MPSFDCKDGSGRSEIGLAHDVSRSAEIRRYADTLENGGSGKKAVDIRNTKAICTFGNGCDTGR